MAGMIESTIRSLVAPAITGIANLRRSRLKLPPGGNPYLTGIHKPLTREYELTALQVEGAVPPQLDGEYVRIGPNPLKLENEAAYHWFLGEGMVHGVRLQGGEARWYRNRWIRSTRVSRILKEAPKAGPRKGSFDSPNTNVLAHAGKIWALVEAGGYPVELTPELDTRAHNPFSGTLKSAFSAHPHRDPATGELHAICYEADNPDLLSYVRVDVTGKVSRTIPIPVRNGPSVHDCMITDNYVLVMDLPVTFSMKMLLSGINFPYRWNEEHQARIGLLPREGTAAEIIWCPIEPCYIFHIANAFEHEGKVIADVVIHEDMFNAERFFGPDGSSSSLERLRIDPTSKTIERKVLSTDNQEFPRIDERKTSRPHRFIYTVDIGESLVEPAGSRLLKYDLETDTHEVHDFGEGRIPGEFVFVPESNGAGEDQGWLIGYVIDRNQSQTALVILRADCFAGEAVASVIIPHLIPPGFHGNWIEAANLAEGKT